MKYLKFYLLTVISVFIVHNSVYSRSGDFVLGIGSNILMPMHDLNSLYNGGVGVNLNAASYLADKVMLGGFIDLNYLLNVGNREAYGNNKAIKIEGGAFNFDCGLNLKVLFGNSKKKTMPFIGCGMQYGYYGIDYTISLDQYGNDRIEKSKSVYSIGVNPEFGIAIFSSKKEAVFISLKYAINVTLDDSDFGMYNNDLTFPLSSKNFGSLALCFTMQMVL